MVSNFGMFICLLSLYDFLIVQSSHELIDHEVLCLVMSVIGSYVSWIDINLIANNKFVRLVIELIL